MHVRLGKKSTSANQTEANFVEALAAKLDFVVPKEGAGGILTSHSPPSFVHQSADFARARSCNPRPWQTWRAAPGAWDALCICFEESAQRFKSENKGHPPVLVIDGAEFLMTNKPFVESRAKAGCT